MTRDAGQVGPPVGPDDDPSPGGPGADVPAGDVAVDDGVTTEGRTTGDAPDGDRHARPGGDRPVGGGGAGDLREAGAPCDVGAADGADSPVVTHDRQAFPPLAGAPVFGDPGHQGAVIPVPGPLTPGVPDTTVDFFTAKPFELRAVSTRGLSHRHLGTPRQDSCATAVSEDWVAIAVADGVSQARWSHVAAETAARVAVRLAIRAAPAVDWAMVAARASMRIAEEVVHRGIAAPQAEGEDTGDYLRAVSAEAATTLVVALVARHAATGAGQTGGHQGEVAVLAGDSGAYLVRESVLVSAVGGKDAGAAIASTAVRPLPGASSPEVVGVSLGPGEALLLVSDGIGDPLGDADNDLGAELSARWATPPTADSLVRDINFLRRSYDDDRTVIGAWVLPDLHPSHDPVAADPSSRGGPVPDDSAASEA